MYVCMYVIKSSKCPSCRNTSTGGGAMDKDEALLLCCRPTLPPRRYVCMFVCMYVCKYVRTCI